MLHTRLIKKPVGRIGLTLQEKGKHVKTEQYEHAVFQSFIYNHRKYKVFTMRGHVEYITCGNLIIK